MLFGKKQDTSKVPIEEAKQLSSQGLSDKAVIEELKKRGYSFEAIQKAMLQMVKDTAEPEPQLPQLEPMEPELPKLDDLGPEPNADLPPIDEGSDDVENPEDIVEELVEGIVEEKIKPFSKRMDKLEEKLAGLKADIEKVQEIKKQNINIAEMSMKISEFETKMMDFSVRIGALEKAFKQLLPSLVDNVHSLSRLVHELKKGHEELRQSIRQDFSPVRRSEPQQPAENPPEKKEASSSGMGLTDEEIRKILGQS